MSKNTSCQTSFLPLRGNSISTTNCFPSHFGPKPDSAFWRSHPCGLVLIHHRPCNPFVLSHHEKPTPYPSSEGLWSCISSKTVTPPGPRRHTSSPWPVPPFGVHSSGSNFSVIDHLPSNAFARLCISGAG